MHMPEVMRTHSIPTDQNIEDQQALSHKAHIKMPKKSILRNSRSQVSE